MFVRYISLTAIALSLQLLLAGCATNTAPRDWLSDAEETEKQAFGAWISVMYQGTPGNSSRADGEFIALDENKIYVLTLQEFTPIDREKIEKASITAYDSKARQIGLWTLFGSLSTVSHGVALIISMPAWILVGSIATASQSYAPVNNHPPASWENLRKYARFPQGLPQSFNPGDLSEKQGF